MLRFIHTADWQIGKTFGGFAPERQGVLREARLAVIDRIADAARRSGAAHVLVAGDVLDSEALPMGDIRRLMERLNGASPLTWHLLPGNHDPDRPGGLYERLARSGVPANVRLHREAAVASLAPGVALLPSPLKSRATATDPTAWMDAAPTPPGTIRIGLAHGSAQGFGASSVQGVRIARDRRRSAGLAYLALGDWHGTREVAEGVWYSGTPEPDRYLDNTSGQVLAVGIGGAAGLEVAPVATAHYRWIGRKLPIQSAGGISPLVRELEGLGSLDRTLLRLELVGRVSLALHGAALAELAALSDRLFHLDLDREGFEVQPEGDEVSSLGAETDLARVARRLLALRDGGTTPEAERALEILFRLAAEGAT